MKDAFRYSVVYTLRIYSLFFPPFMEPEGSVPCSQEPATDSYPKLDASSPHIPTLLPQDPF
jgi:hypothetical protein